MHSAGWPPRNLAMPCPTWWSSHIVPGELNRALRKLADAQLKVTQQEIAEALAEGEFQPFPTAEELGVEDPSTDETNSAAVDGQPLATGSNAGCFARALDAA
jgi:hypothetical protein